MSTTVNGYTVPTGDDAPNAPEAFATLAEQLLPAGNPLYSNRAIFTATWTDSPVPQDSYPLAPVVFDQIVNEINASIGTDITTLRLPIGKYLISINFCDQLTSSYPENVNAYAAYVRIDGHRSSNIVHVPINGAQPARGQVVGSRFVEVTENDQDLDILLASALTDTSSHSHAHRADMMVTIDIQKFA